MLFESTKTASRQHRMRCYKVLSHRERRELSLSCIEREASPRCDSIASMRQHRCRQGMHHASRLHRRCDPDNLPGRRDKMLSPLQATVDARQDCPMLDKRCNSMGKRREPYLACNATACALFSLDGPSLVKHPCLYFFFFFIFFPLFYLAGWMKKRCLMLDKDA